MRFSWRGEPIYDVKAWAHERGERMVTYRAERRVPNIVTGELDTETMSGQMPESFWSNLRMDSGWTYQEIAMS